jgi:hypothetical protein
MDWRVLLLPPLFLLYALCLLWTFSRVEWWMASW